MSTTKDVGHYDVLWPRSPRQVRAKTLALAKRHTTLNGKTVAQLWDFLFRGDEIFSWLEGALKSRYPDVRFVNWREFGSTHGSDERAVLAALPERLKELKVDAVISAVGA